MIGTEIQNYRIVQMLGKGGMATVYKAQHKTLAGTFAAIKVLHPALAQDPTIRAKFRKEAQLMSGFAHPNIGRVYDYAEDGSHLYLIMEYLEGPTLEEMIRHQTGPIVEKRAKQIFGKILSGVGYAHERGVIHRDLKPANIIITAEDEPKIIDFGIVKMIQDEGHPGATRTGQRIGTPMFMSPEQIISRGIDHRSDIYALGITLFEMITGQLPYNPELLSQFEIEQKIVSEPLPKASEMYPPTSPLIQAAIDKATAKAKEDRFGSCEEFAAALHTPVNNYATPTLPPVAPPPASPRPRTTDYPNPAYSSPGTVEPEPAKKSPVLYIILFIALAAGAYFFLKATHILGEENPPQPTATTVPKDEPKEKSPEPNPVTPPPITAQPLDTANTARDTAWAVPPASPYVEQNVSPREANNLRNVLLRYITLTENSGEGITSLDVNGILNMFSYPVVRYFGINNALPADIERELIRYYNNTVYETAWEIDWDDLTYERMADGNYSVFLAGPYTYRLRKSGEVKTRMVSNQVVLNEDYKIISIYETK